MMKFSLPILTIICNIPIGIGAKTKSSKSQPTFSPTHSPTLSTNPTAFPSNSPSDVPSEEPSSSPSVGPSPILDLLGPRCEDASFDVLFKSFKGIASDYGEDVNENGVLDPDEDVNGDGVLNGETGLYVINVTSSFNLRVEQSFIVGDQSVVINGFPEDNSLPANGTIVASDGAGNVCSFEVDLQPFNETFFDDQMAFPPLVYQHLFGHVSPSPMPEYTAIGIQASAGNYTAKNDVDEEFKIVVAEIIPENNTLISVEDLDELGLQDPELSDDELKQVQDLGLSGFIFVGSFQKNSTSEEVVAYAYTTDAKSPEYSIFVIGATEESLFDDQSLELDLVLSDFEPNIDYDTVLNEIQDEFFSRRRLKEEPYTLRKPASIQNHLETTENTFELNYLQELTASQRSLSTCSAEPKECKCGKKPKTACIFAAIAAAKTAYDNALKAYQLGILTLKQAYELGKKTLKEWYKKTLKKEVLACAIACVIFPPSCFGCAARVALKLLAIVTTKTAALYLAYEAGKKKLDENLKKAKEGFDCQVRKAYATCVECEKCDPCDKDSDCDSKEYPDPHFRMWNRETYDFHGECDMIHVTNDHLDLHMRTETRGRWSAVSQVALRFDSDILEVNQNGNVLLNGVLQDLSQSVLLDGIYPVVKSGATEVTVSMSGAQSIQFYYSPRNGVGILMDAHGSDFYESKGMAGTWNKYGFNNRDGLPINVTSTSNAIEYAVVWEVDAALGDPLLFSTPAEHNCTDTPTVDPPTPTPEEIEAAKKICAGIILNPEEKENCVFDILTDGVDSVQDNIAYTKSFESTERCVAAPVPSPEPSTISNQNETTCADLGGECVFRCDESVNDCLQGPSLCVENIDLASVDDNVRRSRRRMEFVEGCACRLPKQASQSPSASGQPSMAPSEDSSSSPSQTPSLNTKSGKKNKTRKY